MNEAKYWLNWVAVLPGAILAAFIVALFLHLVLYFTLANGEITSGVNIEPIERMFYPFIMAVAFIFYGYKIAPKYKFRTAITLFVIYLIGWSLGSYIAIAKGTIGDTSFKFTGATVLSLVGALLGLYTTKRSEELSKVE